MTGATQLGFSLDRVTSNREYEIDRLVPLAQELAARAGDQGITVADVRIVAVQRGYLTGQEQGKHLSYLGAVMRRAGLKPIGYVRSHIPRSHGNLLRLWVKPCM